MRSLLRGMIAVCGMGRPERMAEQRRHGKPVGKAAHHGRFGKGANERQPGMEPLAEPRAEKDGEHQHQQAAGDQAHTAKRTDAVEIIGSGHARVLEPRVSAPPFKPK